MDGKAVVTVTLQDFSVSLFMHYSPNEIEINRGIQSAISWKTISILSLAISIVEKIAIRIPKAKVCKAIHFFAQYRPIALLSNIAWP